MREGLEGVEGVEGVEGERERECTVRIDTVMMDRQPAVYLV